MQESLWQGKSRRRQSSRCRASKHAWLSNAMRQLGVFATVVEEHLDEPRPAVRIICACCGPGFIVRISSCIILRVIDTERGTCRDCKTSMKIILFTVQLHALNAGGSLTRVRLPPRLQTTWVLLVAACDPLVKVGCFGSDAGGISVSGVHDRFAR